MSDPLDDLQRKIDAANPRNNEEDDAPSSAVGAGIAMRIGVELAAGVGIGVAAGLGLDRWLDTMPLFLIICLFLGFAAGILNMKRAVQQLDKDAR